MLFMNVSPVKCEVNVGLVELKYVKVASWICFFLIIQATFPIGTKLNSTKGDASHALKGKKPLNHRLRSGKAICRFKGLYQDVEITFLLLQSVAALHTFVCV